MIDGERTECFGTGYNLQIVGGSAKRVQGADLAAARLGSAQLAGTDADGIPLKWADAGHASTPWHSGTEHHLTPLTRAGSIGSHGNNIF